MKNIKLLMLCVCGLWMMSLTGCSDAGGSAGMAVVGEGGTGGEGAVDNGEGGTGGGSIPEEPDACQAGPEQEQDDSDDDGITDACDNCPGAANFSQNDSDGDGIGDACDNCPGVRNDDQADMDGDGEGDACDPDDDDDGVGDAPDNCPEDFNPSQRDINGDGAGDACDEDPDGDGLIGDEDSLPHCASAMDSAQVIEVAGEGIMDVDAFLAADFEDICGVKGSINLQDVQGEDQIVLLARKLEEFSQNVRDVTGDILVERTSLGALVMEELITVGGGVRVRNNGELEEMFFLALETVESVRVEENNELEGIFFPALETVGEHVWMQFNNELEGMFFPALETVGENVWVQGTGALDAMSFPALKSMGRLFLLTNRTLDEVFFPVLESVRGALNVIGNGELDGMSFPALETVGWNLSVQNNGELEEIFFPALETVGWSVHVRNNGASEIRFPVLRSIGDEARDQEIDLGGLIIGQLPELAHVSFPNLHRIYSSNGIELEEGGGRVQHTLYIWEVPRLLLRGGIEFLDLDNIEEMPGADENISTLNRLQNPGDEGGLIFGRLGQEIDGEPGHISNHGRIYAPRNIP